jgi:hypothetical protein
MSVVVMLPTTDCDTTGADVALRIVGSREPPTNMVIQIAIDGSANVHIQGRIARNAPWHTLGAAHSTNALIHVKAVQFLRAVASEVGANTKVSVWADWAW